MLAWVWCIRYESNTSLYNNTFILFLFCDNVLGILKTWKWFYWISQFLLLCKVKQGWSTAWFEDLLYISFCIFDCDWNSKYKSYSAYAYTDVCHWISPYLSIYDVTFQTKNVRGCSWVCFHALLMGVDSVLRFFLRERKKASYRSPFFRWMHTFFCGQFHHVQRHCLQGFAWLFAGFVVESHSFELLEICNAKLRYSY